jgi:hypothetical protein
MKSGLSVLMEQLRQIVPGICNLLGVVCKRVRVCLKDKGGDFWHWYMSMCYLLEVNEE